MDISIIIINYNSSEYTKACINSIFKHTLDVNFEIIVVDNKSSEEELSSLKEFHKRTPFTLIESKTNLGFGGGNQFGFQFTSGKYIVFLNNDTVLTENSFLPLIEYADKNPTAGAISITQLDAKNKPFKYAYRQFIDLKYHLFNQQKPTKYYTKKYNSDLTKDPFEVDMVSGAFMFFNSKVFEKSGGFDTNIFLFYEEMDICMRLNKLGYKNIFFPKTSFIHFQGKSSNNIAIRKEFVISYLYVIQKNYPYSYYLILKMVLFLKYGSKAIIKSKKYLPLFLIVLKGGNSLTYSIKSSFNCQTK